MSSPVSPIESASKIPPHADGVVIGPAAGRLSVDLLRGDALFFDPAPSTAPNLGECML
ncbi:hypothetical protein [Sinorhizobium fredii]|uniref:Uncharacterized protein n=1 Tax=Sinorhizobium fredii (strain NBRC 101917 / NGR234) TaxID=394 RepID=Q6W105_SINFN|nr:hypothetical protein [Sinorhizobium fredii]AAQ87563.1 Hypothetical protein RNGR10303 [Sinorhizobium fredii NGR234]